MHGVSHELPTDRQTHSGFASLCIEGLFPLIAAKPCARRALEQIAVIGIVPSKGARKAAARQRQSTILTTGEPGLCAWQ
jgi:hypothetical protein